MLGKSITKSGANLTFSGTNLTFQRRTTRAARARAPPPTLTAFTRPVDPRLGRSVRADRDEAAACRVSRGASLIAGSVPRLAKSGSTFRRAGARPDRAALQRHSVACSRHDTASRAEPMSATTLRGFRRGGACAARLFNMTRGFRRASKADGASTSLPEMVAGLMVTEHAAGRRSLRRRVPAGSYAKHGEKLRVHSVRRASAARLVTANLAR